MPPNPQRTFGALEPPKNLADTFFFGGSVDNIAKGRRIISPAYLTFNNTFLLILILKNP